MSGNENKKDVKVKKKAPIFSKIKEFGSKNKVALVAIGSSVGTLVITGIVFKILDNFDKNSVDTIYRDSDGVLHTSKYDALRDRPCVFTFIELHDGNELGFVKCSEDFADMFLDLNN